MMQEKVNNDDDDDGYYTRFSYITALAMIWEYVYIDQTHYTRINVLRLSIIYFGKSGAIRQTIP